MTHFNTNLRLPVRTGPSPMEDLIVQQVEWYMGRLNLEKDDYLKDQMDDDLWVNLDVILNFPKMKRLGVQDKRRVATLLHARSTIVEVDEKAARIRPAWARRSTIIIHNVPPAARLDQIAALLQIPSNADLSDAHGPPPVAHPPGLISIQPAAETIWLAIFDSPTGAQDTVHLLADKEINGQEVKPEVHVENSLRPNSAYRQADAQQSVYNNARPVDPQQNSHYPHTIPVMSTGMMTNHMMNPIGMPMPVMPHPTQDAHARYPYPSAPTGYAAGYAQDMQVPRQFLGAPRGMHTGYVVAYPHADHAYDPSHAGVQIPRHPIRQQQPQVDQNGVPVIAQPTIPAEGATAAGQDAQAVPAVPNGVVPPPSQGVADHAESAEAGTEFMRDAGISQVQADAQRIAAQIPFAAPVQIPVMAGQPMDGQMIISGQVKPVDIHYMPRGQMMGDPNMYPRGNSRQPGMGRERGQRNADGNMRASRGSMIDGQRSGMHRKGKKGNRGGGRHGHGHDRDRREGKGDGSSSDSGNREDRTLKNKPEPNVASMHFPPLPSSDNGGPRIAPKTLLKKEETTEKASATTVERDIKEVASDGGDETPAAAEPKSDSVVNESEEVQPAQESGSEKESILKDSAQFDEPKTEPTRKEDNAPKVADDSTESKEATSAAEEEEKKPEAKAPAPSPMSYAAILRSKKPGPPPRSAQPSVSRSSSGASGKNTDNSSGSEANSSSASHPPKEKGSRRRKSNNSRSNHIGDTKEASAAATANGNKNEKNVDKKGNDAPRPAESRDTNTAAASAAPSVRAANPQTSIDAKRVSSPVSSQGDEKEAGTEKVTKDINSRAVPNGKPNGAIAPRPTKEEAKDAQANGTVESKDVSEKPVPKATNSSKVNGESTKTSKGSKGTEKAANVPAKGAWAAGGPKAWPKNNGNGVMEKLSNITES